ncbi:sigma factor [Arthrobacter sp. NPDC058127]|uniref:sigma factor n=1 Tax=Arthrobacter sp. NPDC058127 TaxID=3346351 RepID=UPI0036ED1A3E
MGETDEDLLRECVAGDADAFGVLFDRHADAVFRYCLSRCGSWHDAEELVSITFLEAWRQRNRLRPRRETVLPWLLGVATNANRNRARASRRHADFLARLPHSDPRHGEHEADHAESVAARLDAERDVRELIDTTAGLNDGERDVVRSRIRYLAAESLRQIDSRPPSRRVGRLLLPTRQAVHLRFIRRRYGFHVKRFFGHPMTLWPSMRNRLHVYALPDSDLRSALEERQRVLETFDYCSIQPANYLHATLQQFAVASDEVSPEEMDAFMVRLKSLTAETKPFRVELGEPEADDYSLGVRGTITSSWAKLTAAVRDAAAETINNGRPLPDAPFRPHLTLG